MATSDPTTTTEGRLGVVFVHGFMSGPGVWSAMTDLIRQDPALHFVTPLLFRYASPKFRVHPLRRVPTLEVVADKLAGFVEVDAADFSRLALVTHSQEGWSCSATCTARSVTHAGSPSPASSGSSCTRAPAPVRNSP
ncbi:hypothetical protein ACFQ60_35170 [Streptomyces zhihengii]